MRWERALIVERTALGHRPVRLARARAWQPRARDPAPPQAESLSRARPLVDPGACSANALRAADGAVRRNSRACPEGRGAPAIAREGGGAPERAGRAPREEGRPRKHAEGRSKNARARAREREETRRTARARARNSEARTHFANARAIRKRALTSEARTHFGKSKTFARASRESHKISLALCAKAIGGARRRQEYSGRTGRPRARRWERRAEE